MNILLPYGQFATEHAVGIVRDAVKQAQNGNFSALSVPASLSSPSGGGEKIKRPRNAFIIYRNEKHSAVVSENPGVHNNDICKCITLHW